MSTQQQQIGVAVLPPLDTLSADQQVNASRTRWVWNPYRTIYNTGLAGGPPSPIRQMGFVGSHRYSEFERCVFYPLGNISWDEPDREAMAEQSLAGLALSGPAPTKPFIKYAYDQAAELHESFGSRGLRVFQPGLVPGLSWVDDQTLVSQVVSVLQPRPFKLSEMEAEFGPQSVKRIAQSKLTPEGKQLAEAFRKLMQQGGRFAKIEAEREYRELISSMGKASVGQPGISTPNEFHVWVCQQLGMEVPETVHTTKKTDEDSTLKRAVTLLAERAVAEDGLSAELKAKLAASEERGREVMARLTALEEQKAKV